jgi:hypothetical protein
MSGIIVLSRRIAALCICVLLCGQAAADAHADLAAEELMAASSQPAELRHIEVLTALEQAGYTLVELRRTWLNRILIRARNSHHLREIVISRSTGSVLRDVVIETYGEGDGGQRWLDEMPPDDIAPGDIDPELFPQ